MQLHVNDEADAPVDDDFDTAVSEMLNGWRIGWRTAELWNKGICVARAMRVPYIGTDVMVVVTWTDSKICHAELHNVTDGCRAGRMESVQVY